MELGVAGNKIILGNMINLLPKIKNKYWKLGKIIAVTQLPDDIKNSYYSLGNEIDQFLKLSKMLSGEETINEPGH